MAKKGYTQEQIINLKRHGEKIIEVNSADREYSILGGGDIAFPCLLTASFIFYPMPSPRSYHCMGYLLYT